MSKELEKYPIGRYQKPTSVTKETIENCIESIERFPNQMEVLTKNLNNEELQRKYREGGWTIEQVVHHCADSHMNAYMRVKLTLTENTPKIKPYHQDKWAKLADYGQQSIDDSLTLIKVLHKRWVFLLRSLTPSSLKKEFYHPEQNENVSLEELVCIYCWHCEHHLKHVENALRK